MLWSVSFFKWVTYKVGIYPAENYGGRVYDFEIIVFVDFHKESGVNVSVGVLSSLHDL